MVNVETVNKLLDEINDDRTVPKNVRAMVQNARGNLNDQKQEIAVRVNTAISILDEVSNDPNIPIYTRTHVWNIVSLLEAGLE